MSVRFATIHLDWNVFYGNIDAGNAQRNAASLAESAKEGLILRAVLALAPTLAALHLPLRFYIQTLNEAMADADALPLVKGTLDVLVLKALSWAPMHGFEIIQWLERRAEDNLTVNDSALYQAVYRLEGRGLVKAEWGLTENNRRARYYALTPAGRTHLTEETTRLVRYSETMIGILKDAPAGQGT